MYHGFRIAVCIPAHNEQNFIEQVIKSLPDFIDYIIVVDDHSTDETYSILQKSAESRLIVVHHIENTGVGGATISAQDIACKNKADVLIRMDGDGQMDPIFIPTLLDPIVFGVSEYTKGNRLASREHINSMPKIRIFGNFVLTYMNKMLTGYWTITDSQNGYTAIRRTTLEKIDYKTLARGYMFENDMLFRLNQINAAVLDIPMPSNYGEEVSGIKISKVIPEYLRFFSLAVMKRLWRKYILKLNIYFACSVIGFFALLFYGFFELSQAYWGRALVSWLGSVLMLCIGAGIDIANEPHPSHALIPVDEIIKDKESPNAN